MWRISRRIIVDMKNFPLGHWTYSRMIENTPIHTGFRADHRYKIKVDR